MTLLDSPELTPPAGDPPAADDALLSELSAKNLWRSEAPEAVRSAWKRVGKAEAWTEWLAWLDRRETADPFEDAPRRAGPPLAWGADDDSAAGLQWLLDPPAVTAWLETGAQRDSDVRFALECVALADATPGLAARLDEGVWWRLCDTLLRTATEAAAAASPEQPTADAALVQQLLAGELPFALAAAAPEIKPFHQLRSEGAAALSDGLERLCDGEGLPHVDLLPRLPMLAACWTRSALRAEALGKKPWTSDADTQFEWFVRQLLRYVDRDGRMPFDPAPAPGAATLLRVMLDRSGDDEDFAAAAQRLKGFSDDDDSDAPEASNHSEWAGVSVLASSWGDRAPRLTVTHADRTMRIELCANRATLLSGDWPIDAKRDGVAVEPDDDWDVSCWFSDEDCDYLELSIDLVGGGTLERLLFLSRDDGVAMLGELLLPEKSEASKLSIATRLPFADGVSLRAEEETHESVLVAGGKPQACVFPLALPEWRTEKACGSLGEKNGGLDYRVETEGANLAAPLWLDLTPKRFAKQRTWRRLTIAESLERVAPDVAVGYRVQSGADQWIMYRSLARRANRTLLGHNLSSESLIGKFLKTGEVDEYFEIEED